MGRAYTKKSTITTRPRKYSLEEIAERYNTGISAAEVGRQLGIHHTTVIYALGQLGISRVRRPASRRGTGGGGTGWVDYSAYRTKWRAERGIGPVARMVQIVSRRKPRLAL